MPAAKKYTPEGDDEGSSTDMQTSASVSVQAENVPSAERNTDKWRGQGGRYYIDENGNRVKRED